ncbi:MAG: NAD(P)H-hydrate dehydratase, partial [Acidiferrobacterales bacterium]
VQAQRFDAVRSLAERFGGVIVLKGAGTLIAKSGGRDVWLCDAGNPGMASGGMGDVLTGIIAALLAQGLSRLDAARLGVWLHATAADDAVRENGEIGLLASDLLPLVRMRLNRLSIHGA